MSDISISDAVSHIIERDGNLKMFMSEGLINFYAFARKYRNDICAAVGRDADIPSISMAARRYVRSCDRISSKKFDFDIVVSDKTIDYNVRCTPQVLDELVALYSARRDNELNFSIYKDKLTIIAHEKNEPAIESNPFLSENLIFKLRDLACIHLRFKGDFLNTPGVMHNVLKLFQANGINVFEVLSSNMELMFVIREINLKVAYSLLKGFFM